MNNLFGKQPLNDLRDAAPSGPVKVIDAKTGKVLRYEEATFDARKKAKCHKR